jgi:3-oxoacyl-(acyl-carrier-protein) synthase
VYQSCSCTAASWRNIDQRVHEQTVLSGALCCAANIICEYLGGAVTCDAHHMTDPRADGLGVATCIEKALQDSGARFAD